MCTRSTRDTRLSCSSTVCRVCGLLHCTRRQPPGQGAGMGMHSWSTSNDRCNSLHLCCCRHWRCIWPAFMQNLPCRPLPACDVMLGPLTAIVAHASQCTVAPRVAGIHLPNKVYYCLWKCRAAELDPSTAGQICKHRTAAMSSSAINALLGAQTKDSVSWLLNACFRNRHNSSLVRASWSTHVYEATSTASCHGKRLR